MGSEKQTWRNIKSGLERLKKIKFQRFEDALSCGIPDTMVCYEGRTTFIELKHLNAFPKRESTPVRLDYRRNQWVWGKEYIDTGGSYLLLAQVGINYYFFSNPAALLALREDQYTKAEFVDAARAIFDNGIEAANFIAKGFHNGKSIK